MQVDVAVLTKNSQETLRECLQSIYDNVNVNRLIVVDGYSTDKTLDIVKEFEELYGNVVVIMDKGTRATARQKAIEAVETDWFMFVDSDVVLCDRWLEKAKKYISDDVGAVWGIEIWSVIENPIMLKVFSHITMDIFRVRGGTHDILIRKEAIEGIRIPPNLHVLEDAYICNWIKQRGYRVVGTYDPYCIHKRHVSIWSISSGVNIAVESFKCGVLHYPRLLPSYVFYAGYFGYQAILHKFKRRYKQ